MASPLNYLTEGTRIFLNSLKRRISFPEYPGTADEICRQIIEDCWNGHYFQTSKGNFSQFWTRDFGWCTSSLIKLGYQQKVLQTLRYAMNRFRDDNKITTTITPNGKPYDFPYEAVDSLPWLVHSLRVAKFNYYDYHEFLSEQVKKYFERFIDPQTGLVKKELPVSSMKDFAVRESSCYDNCLVALLARNLKQMKIDNPFENYDYEELILDYFWNGRYFYDDLKKHNYVAGDANIFPFITGVVTDKNKLRLAIKAIQSEGLDKPFPLRYTKSREKINFTWQEMLMRDYESDTVWTHMGLLYIKLVQQMDPGKAKEYKAKYTERIEKYHNFLEVFFSGGKPYKNMFYFSDSGMLWAANYLTLD